MDGRKGEGMTTDEGQMRAACVMRDAADNNHREADRIEESVRQMNMIFDAGYGGTAPRLLEALEKANTALESDLATARKLLEVAKCPNCDGCGFTVREEGGCDSDGENDTREYSQEQCQWCFERNGLLSQPPAPEQERGKG